MGRTHGVHAEPTTFGLKMALWYEEMKRNLERFRHAADGVQFGKMSGAVGTYAQHRSICRRISYAASSALQQRRSRRKRCSVTVMRNIWRHWRWSLHRSISSLPKFAPLQKSEFREVEEPFAKGQKGSSAMPHKRNPIGCENISGLSRVIRGHMISAYENVTLWHERDISPFIR